MKGDTSPQSNFMKVVIFKTNKGFSKPSNILQKKSPFFKLMKGILNTLNGPMKVVTFLTKKGFINPSNMLKKTVIIFLAPLNGPMKV